MEMQTNTSHPVEKKVGLFGKNEPIVVGLVAAVVFAVLSLVSSAQDELSISEAITDFGTIAMMLAGGNWARNRVISVNSFDGQRNHIEIEARRIERAVIENERAADIEAFTEMEQLYDPSPDLGVEY